MDGFVKEDMLNRVYPDEKSDRDIKAHTVLRARICDVTVAHWGEHYSIAVMISFIM